MLDELLGRAALKDQIETLEEERESLEQQLAAANDRRRVAVRDRQAADKQVNQLEDRIADLEGQLSRFQEDNPEDTFQRVKTLRLSRCEEVIGRIASLRTAPEAVYSACITETDLDMGLPDVLSENRTLLERAAPCLVYTDDEGLLQVFLDPPLAPEPFTHWDDHARIQPDWFVPHGQFSFALVRSDLCAIGEYDGQELLEWQGFESDVMGSHSKGGFSQSRFERRRDGQINEHIDRCRGAIEDVDSDTLIVVGERSVLSPFRDDAVATATVDATGSPKAALLDAFETFWRTQLYLP